MHSRGQLQPGGNLYNGFFFGQGSPAIIKLDAKPPRDRIPAAWLSIYVEIEKKFLVWTTLPKRCFSVMLGIGGPFSGGALFLVSSKHTM